MKVLRFADSFWHFCHECDARVDVVQVGQEPDYESATANVCLVCLKKAVALLEQSA